MCDTAFTRQQWLRVHASITRLFVRALSVLFQLPDLSSFPLAQMLTHYMTAVLWAV